MRVNPQGPSESAEKKERQIQSIVEIKYNQLRVLSLLLRSLGRRVPRHNNASVNLNFRRQISHQKFFGGKLRRSRDYSSAVSRDQNTLLVPDFCLAITTSTTTTNANVGNKNKRFIHQGWIHRPSMTEIPLFQH